MQFAPKQPLSAKKVPLCGPFKNPGSEVRTAQFCAVQPVKSPVSNPEFVTRFALNAVEPVNNSNATIKHVGFTFLLDEGRVPFG
jgi:hypothetical protein